MFAGFFARTLRLGAFSTSLSSGQLRQRNRRGRCRPIVERLETRDLLTAGDLDLSFGSGGLVVNDLSPSTDGAIDVIFQADGKIVAGGYTTNSQGERDSVLRRYNTNGSLDTSFGSDGMTVTDFKGGWSDQGLALAAQPDGKIIGVASSYNPNDFTFPFDARWGVARYTSNGALDKSFGTQGKTVTDLSKGTDTVTGVALQADGKIVVSGNTNGFAGGDNFFVARYNANGSTDNTFGAGKGYVITDFGGSDGSAELAIQGDGKIVVVGRGGPLGDLNQFAIARYNTSGSLDPTFGSGGKVLTAFNDGALDVLVQPDGRIVVSGGTIVARYLSLNGSLDPSFGVGGAGYVVAGGHSLTAQADGKLVLGNKESFYEDLGDGSNIQSSRFVLTRISGVDGSVDTSFGTSGRVTTYLTEPGKRGSNQLNAVAVQADGHIVGAAQTGVYDATGKLNAKFTLVRYLGDDPPATASTDFALFLFMDDSAAAKRRGG
jgi:uncharacterized delta-60 repeat protein